LAYFNLEVVDLFADFALLLVGVFDTLFKLLAVSLLLLEEQFVSCRTVLRGLMLASDFDMVRTERNNLAESVIDFFHFRFAILLEARSFNV
jgi:hypothetical protein